MQTDSSLRGGGMLQDAFSCLDLHGGGSEVHVQCQNLQGCACSSSFSQQFLTAVVVEGWYGVLAVSSTPRHACRLSLL